MLRRRRVESYLFFATCSIIGKPDLELVATRWGFPDRGEMYIDKHHVGGAIPRPPSKVRISSIYVANTPVMMEAFILEPADDKTRRLIEKMKPKDVPDKRRDARWEEWYRYREHGHPKE